MRNASAADAAADRPRNERRDAEERLRSLLLLLDITHLVAAILPQNRWGFIRGTSCLEVSVFSAQLFVPPERWNGPCARGARAGWQEYLYEEDRVYSRVSRNPIRRFLFRPNGR